MRALNAHYVNRNAQQIKSLTPLLRSLRLFAIVLTAITALSACGRQAQKDRPLVFSGTIETREIRVGSKIGGRVAGVLIKEGQQVTAGQTLVRLDVTELTTQIKQAEARIAQHQVRLDKLERGARLEEKSQAHAATESARANLEAVRNWPRQEELAQARASLAAAEAESASAEANFHRANQLFASGDISRQDFDAAKYRFDKLKAHRDAEKQRLELLLNGSRPEDIRAAEERYQQALAAERLVLSGPRAEEIQDAREQLREAEARLEQLKVQLDEGEVRAPTIAIVEVLSVRPGDILTPNQPVAKLLEEDQMWARIYVPEPQLGMIRVGQRAQVKIDTFPDRSFEGMIEQINAQGEFTPRNVQSRDERNHQVFGVKVRVENREGIIKSGMAADVTLEPETARTRN